MPPRRECAVRPSDGVSPLLVCARSRVPRVQFGSGQLKLRCALAKAPQHISCPAAELKEAPRGREVDGKSPCDERHFASETRSSAPRARPGPGRLRIEALAGLGQFRCEPPYPVRRFRPSAAFWAGPAPDSKRVPHVRQIFTGAFARRGGGARYRAYADAAEASSEPRSERREPVAESVSVVVPVFNSASTLDQLYERVAARCPRCRSPRWELILVNDGSADSSWDHIVGLSRSTRWFAAST